MGATPGQHAARRLRKKVKKMPTGLPPEQWQQWMQQIAGMGQQQRAQLAGMGVEPGSLAFERGMAGFQPMQAQAIQGAQAQRAMFERQGALSKLGMLGQGVQQQLAGEASTWGGIGQLGGMALGGWLGGRGGGGGGFMGGFGQGAGQAAGQWAGGAAFPQERPQLTPRDPLAGMYAPAF